MSLSISRRSLLASASAAVTSLMIGGCASSGKAAAAKPRYRISLAEWSLHRKLKGGQMENLEFPAAARAFGCEGVEYVNQFFMDKARDEKYLAALKQRSADAGVENVLIMCDREGDLGAPDAAKRTEAVENHYKWVDAAKFLGCHSIRVNAKSAGAYEEQIKLAADGLARLTDYGAKRDINVIVENHGGLSSNGAWLASVIRTVNHPRCGTLPDFGNFRINAYSEKEPVMYDRYKGVAEMMPFAKGVSAKSHDFDAQGNEVNTDYRRMMKIVSDAGYRGFIGIEYEGKTLSEEDGIRATKKLLDKVLAEMNA